MLVDDCYDILMVHLQNHFYSAALVRLLCTNFPSLNWRFALSAHDMIMDLSMAYHTCPCLPYRLPHAHIAEIDHTFSAAARHKAEEILIDPQYAPKPEYHLQLYGGVAHGWALRGDPAIEKERESFLFFLPKLASPALVLVTHICMDIYDLGWSKEECARSMDAWFDRFCNLA